MFTSIDVSTGPLVRCSSFEAERPRWRAARNSAISPPFEETTSWTALVSRDGLWRGLKGLFDETAGSIQTKVDSGLGGDDEFSLHGLLPDGVFDRRLSMATEDGVCQLE